MNDETILKALFEAALDAARPESKFAGRLPPPPRGRTIVLGAGKAAAGMARVFEEVWRGPCEGLVVTRYGHAVPTRTIEVVEAAHPVPDEAGQQAARRILEMAQAAGPDDLVIWLGSGGASALLTLPAPGVTLADKQALNRALLRSGAPIGAMNRVRKALSAIKGGRLAQAAAPARVVTYLISDVPGDDPAIIGSGPTIPDAAGPDVALEILKTYKIDVSPALLKAIQENAAPSTAVEGNEVHLLVTPKMALDAAARKARELGFTPLVLGDAIEGEAREVGAVLAGIARSVVAYGEPLARPCVLLSGGETTVTMRGAGRGGRNSEFLLSLALHTSDLPQVSAIAADTDGIDGSEDNAGAWFDQTIRSAPLDAARCLADNDAYTFFKAAGRLVVTGPTLTNVNDFRAVLIR